MDELATWRRSAWHASCRRSTFPVSTAGGTRWRRRAAANGIVVMFICNHCPYVKAVIDKDRARHE